MQGICRSFSQLLWRTWGYCKKVSFLNQRKDSMAFVSMDFVSNWLFKKCYKILVIKFVRYLCDKSRLWFQTIDTQMSSFHYSFTLACTVDIYSSFRWITLLSISLAVVFVVLLTFLSLISGALGASPSDTPSTRSGISNCAGNALMW